MKSVIAVVVCLVALGAGQVATLPQGAEERASSVSALFDRGALTVMTRDLNPAASLERVLEVSGAAQVPARTAEVFSTLRHEDMARRARLLADEIQYARPHLIGLQQVLQVRLQSPGDALFGGQRAAQALYLDVLPVLLTELETRGLHYREVARVKNADVELPLLTHAGSFDDLRLTDFDVILARGDVDVTGARTGNYLARRELTRPGMDPLELPRGWVSVVASVEGRRCRFVSTHLEPLDEGLHVQQAQAEELILSLSGERLPVVLVGDFNTPANLGLVAAPTYGSLLRAGYVDVWTGRLGSELGGRTDVALEPLALEERRNLVLLRGPVTQDARRVGPVLAYAVGSMREERRFGPWRSNGAGVVARLRMPAQTRN